MKKRILISSAAVAALMMTGCGGGSSDSVTSGVSSSAIVEGVAVDDLILNGKVIAVDENNQTLAEGRTSSGDGSYTLTLAHQGVVVVNVSCDENSSMKDMLTGNIQRCGAEVNLHAVTAVEPGVKTKVNITPLTQVVYERAKTLAEADSKLDPEDVEKARTEIGLMFGLDPVADDPTQGTYAEVVQSIDQLAEEDNSTVMGVATALADELADGEAEGDADETVKALAQLMHDENITNPLTETNGTYAPPTNAASLSDVEAAKALADELRAQAMSVVDYQNSGTPGFLDNEASAMDTALQNVTMNIGYMGDAIDTIANMIGESYAQGQIHIQKNPMGPTRVFTVDKTGTGAWSYEIVEGGTTWSGTVSFPEVLLGDQAESQLYTTGTLTMNVQGDVPLDYTAVTESGVEDKQSFEGTVTMTKKATGTDISLSGLVASNGTSIELKEAKAELAYEDATDSDGQTYTKFNYFKLNKIVLQGKVGAYTIDGSLVVNKYTQNTKLASKGGVYEVENGYYSGMISCPYSAVSDANVTLTYNGVTYESSWSNNSYEYMFGFNDIPVNLDYNEVANYVNFEATCDNGTDTPELVINESWGYSYDEIANSGWLPSDLSFEGAISRTGALLKGTLNAKWLNAKNIDLDGNDIPLVDVKFNGILEMPERPEMLTTLHFNNNAGNELSASYSYDTTVINLSALLNAEMQPVEASITTHNGLDLEIVVNDDDSVDGNLTKDGKLVGTVEERNGAPVIKYIDGTFESLM